MRVLLTGYSGFIGRHLVDALGRRGHLLVLAGRNEARGLPPGWRAAEVDFARQPAADWPSLLEGVDAVVNAVGIFKEHGSQRFEALHVQGPGELFEACVQGGVRRVVQISALGADAGARSAYHLSKRAADEWLLRLPLSAFVAQPSLVFGAEGASSRLFLSLASLPLLPLPAGGRQQIQPIHIDDLVEALCRLVEAPPNRPSARIALVGPEALGLGEYLQGLRRGLWLPRAPTLAVPTAFVEVAASAAGRLPALPFDRDAWQMLQRGNVAPVEPIAALLGRLPRAPRDSVPSRWAGALRHSVQLVWLAGLLRLSIAAVWLGTAYVSLLVYPRAESLALLARSGVPPALQRLALDAAAGLDLAFGVATLLPLGRWLWAAQALLIVVYTLIISLRLPEYWAHPYGPLLKNLPMLAALVVLYVLGRRDAKKPPWNT